VFGDGHNFPLFTVPAASTHREIVYTAGRVSLGVAKLSVLVLVLLGALGFSVGVHAAPKVSPQAEQAAAHYEAGQRAYAESRWEDALREFQLGYALAPRPEFLINFAQVHRKLGRLGDATLDCERYLAAAPNSPMAAEVTRLLGVMREEHAAQLRGEGGGVERPTAPLEAPASVPRAVVPATPTVAPTLAEAKPRRRRAALIGGLVAGGVVLAGVAITLGVVFGTRGNHYPDAQLQGDFR
jgi:hypothetical protein